MALPFLAFAGLGFGANYLLDKYNEFTTDSRAADITGRAANIIGESGTEQMGPRREGVQAPLMSRGTGLMGGELPPEQAASQLMGLGGGFAQTGQKMLEQRLGLAAPPAPPNIQTVQSGAGDGQQVTKMLVPGLGAVDIPGVEPRKGGGGITIQNMPELPAGYMAQDPNDLSKGVVPIPGGPKDEPSPGTGEEKTARGFLDRQQAASQGMEQLMAEEPENADVGFFDAINGKASFGDVFNADAVDPTGVQMAAGRMGPGVLESTILNPKQQQYLQYARDWIRAKLRKESGAVINADEWADEYQTFFPMPGDSPETIAQKKEARRVSEESMRTMAGAAAPVIRKPGDEWVENGRRHRMNQEGVIQREKLK